MRLKGLFKRVMPGRATLALEERLRFEALLSELSAGLIHVPAAGIDAACGLALQQVGTFLGVDHANLDGLDGLDGAPAELHISWASPGLPEPPRVTGADHSPWTAARLAQGALVRFSRVDELPPEAAIDRASYRRAAIQSMVLLPLRAAGVILGVLSFAAVRRRLAWPDELVERLHLLSQAFANALERKRMEISLAERLRFEKLLGALSTSFSHLSPVDFDLAAQRALRWVVDFLGVDRGSLIEFSRDGGTAGSWAIEEWMDMGEFPWMAARLQHGDVVDFSRLETLPDEAAVDRQNYLAHRVKPQVAVPLRVGKVVIGGLVFSTVVAARARSDDLLQQLHLIGEIFANALSRKQRELEAQRLRQDLTHLGRVSALGELVASLAHELNQPLMAILSNAQAAQQLLASDAVNLEEVREILADIATDDHRATDIIRRLGGLIKKGDLDFVPLDLNELVAEVARLVRGDAIRRDVSLSLEFADDLPQVQGDRVQLQQVVLNLVLNALDAIRDAAGSDRTLAIRTARHGDAAVIVAVRDTGIGLDETAGDRIFQPLYTTKPDGLGMGLAIARTIVSAHGGALGAASNAHGGATFHFTLPALPETPP